MYAGAVLPTVGRPSTMTIRMDVVGVRNHPITAVVDGDWSEIGVT